MSADNAAGASEIEAARLLLARMGLSPEQLVDTPAEQPPAPTFADYIPKVAEAASDGTRRVYRSYWNKILTAWSERRLDEPSASEIKHLAEQVRSQVVQRRNARARLAESLVTSPFPGCAGRSRSRRRTRAG